MEFRYWPGESKWGLPSIDIQSLELLVYMKFAKANVALKPTYKSWLFTKGCVLPSLETTEGNLLTTSDEIYQYLRLKYYDLDISLAKEEKIKIAALKSLIKEKLLPALNSYLWLDAVNYTELSRNVYATRCKYPLNFTLPQQKRDDFANLLLAKTNNSIDITKVSDTIHNKALHIIDLLDDYLAENKKYILGERACSVDACLFSCLAVLLKMTLPNCKLQQRIRNKQNLTRYVNNILKEHFSDAISVKPKESPASNNEDDHEKYEWVFPVAVATVAMVSYAINIGLLQIARK